jgi:predicted secreted hydrolase
MEGIDRMRVTARGAEFAYDLELVADGPLVLQGESGYSVKSPDGQASHYYSQPFYRVSGVLDLPGGSVNVSGQGWLDREWSSQPLSEDQLGWDWFSLQFEDGARLMGFGLRGSETVFTSATWIEADGATTAFADGALRLTPLNRALVAGRNIPVEWRVELPARGVDVEVEALNPGAWMGVSFPYWEGPIRVRGSHEGRGYLEMTGY